MVGVGPDGGFSDAFFPRGVGADAHGFRTSGVGAEDVFGPLHGKSVGAVEE